MDKNGSEASSEKNYAEETPHLVAHFMATGAEKRLEDYHFLRNTYETINSQEIQLNRILRMLGEDEFNLNWRTEFLPMGRARTRSAYDFDQWSRAMTLKGSIAYERLRELEHDSTKVGGATLPTTSRRVQELRERRQRLSEQREFVPSPSGRASSVAASSRLQAVAEYDTALIESETKRKRQAEENRPNTPNNEENDLTTKRREKLKAMLEEESKNYEKSRNEEFESNKRLTNDNNLIKDQNEHALKDQNENVLKDDANNVDKNRKSSADSDQENSGDIELMSFTVRWEPASSSNKTQDDNDSLIRLFCQWTSPNSSSAIDYLTIERQFGDQEWLPIGEKINKLDNQTQLDMSLMNDNDEKTNATTPSLFRLKAHLQNGQTITSKPTDEIFMNLCPEKNIIIPDVEVLSPSSVQLTWNNTEDEEKPNIYDIEKKEDEQLQWEKVTEVPLSQRSARIDSLTDANQCQFRLISSSKSEVEPEVLTVHNVNEWLNSLHINPTSTNTVDIDISEEGFKAFDSYKIEYTIVDESDHWTQMSDITHDNPHLAIKNLKKGADYHFRFTPISPATTKATATMNGVDTSQFSVVLDVKMPSIRKGRFTSSENEAPAVATVPPTSTPPPPPPQFSIQKLDATSVLIEAVVPEEETPTFEDVFDVYSKNETMDDDWTKVGTIDKEHLSTKVENLEENMAYSFKIDNTTSPLDEEQVNTVQELKFDTTPVKLYDPSALLEKIEKNLENVVNNVMQAAAGHQTLDEPVNKSLNEVIKDAFREEALVTNEEFGFDTLVLNDDLLLYRGPKQMMLKELEVDETGDLSKHYGEIIIHNYCTTDQSVVVREDNSNTRVENIDGDIIIRNVISDVLLKNEQTRHQLSMNIVGQAFLKGVQGSLVASKFKGIIVVKNVHKP
ncbi:unnamed protein product [Rotaria magnacalcarata]|uniref:Fibronectin type-III domain-containing protein n=2 Tax=Rotaria magnacalcarata TaxID=392030 RepID=A0A8S2LDF5_9BILA|nr:unnamed protein product [Rotaria magnacalcarata]